jgi:putative transcriptional regulator
VGVNNRLKDIRHDLRLNQTEFATFLDINVNQYNRYESNKGKQPNLETSLRIFERIKERLPEKKFEDVFIRVPD